MDKKRLLSICSPPGPHPSLSVLLQVLGVYQGTHLPLALMRAGPKRGTQGNRGWGALLPPSLWPGFLAVALNLQFLLPSSSPFPTVPAFSWL